MKEISKVRKIYEGFFGDTVPNEVAESRRKECNACEYNSKNAESLSTFDSIRNTFTKPFCTVCKCQIFEKTGSPYEECAMYMLGKEKKWYKVKIETMENDKLNLIQTQEKKFDISLDGEVFVIDLGQISVVKDSVMELIFQSKPGHSIKFKKFSVSCGCTSYDTETLDDNNIQVKLKVEPRGMPTGRYVKEVSLQYLMDDELKFQPVKIKFFKV